MIEIIEADWSAPANVFAFTTTRLGGTSVGAYASLNLGSHVADNPAAVTDNRQRLQSKYLPTTPTWLQQTHSNRVVTLPSSASLEADAAFSLTPKTICTVLTADCLPLLICNKSGTEIAAIHAGWRGLLAGIISNTLTQFSSKPEDLLVWLGPAISVDHFAINNDIRQAFVSRLRAFVGGFIEHDQQIYADLYQLARIELNTIGVTHISGGNYCTYRQHELFFSHRRDQGITGRQASCIWFESH